MTVPKSDVVIPGDPFGSSKPDKKDDERPTARQVADFHTHADRDGSTGALHHTLGPGHNQASPGDHLHNGQTSKLIGTGQSITGSRSGGTALQNLIVALGFTDSTTA